MKTVKQQAEVSFKLLDFADKVVMLPIMDRLAKSVKDEETLEITVNDTFTTQPYQAKKMLKVLSDLGCRTSLGESYEDIVKSDNSQSNNSEKTPHFLYLKSVKDDEYTTAFLSDALAIEKEKAKNIVNNYPICINLKNYGITANMYKDLINGLNATGAEAELTTKEQIVINTEKDFVQKFSAVLNTSNKVKIAFCCDLTHPIERITLIAIIKDVANISVENAKNTFDNRNIDRIDFLLDSERLRYYYNKLKDYIKYGGKLILQPIKQ